MLTKAPHATVTVPTAPFPLFTVIQRAKTLREMLIQSQGASQQTKLSTAVVNLGSNAQHEVGCPGII